jgi:hypothetical protein
METMGLMESTVTERMKILGSLNKPGKENRLRRQQLSRDIEHTSREFHAIGAEMNHRYESRLVILDDEVKNKRTPPDFQASDPVLYHVPLHSQDTGSRMYGSTTEHLRSRTSAQ